MKLFIWLSGNDPAVLARCPTERMRCSASGGTVAVVSLLAAISGTATTHAFLRLPLALAIAAGLFWGAAIMTLDRWFLTSIRRQSSSRATLAMASPRVLLAIVSAIVISAPILLAIFHTEINARARTEKQAASAAAWRKLERHFADVPKLEAAAKGIEHQLTSVQTGSAVLADPEYKRLSHETSKLEAEANQWRQKAACENDGSCGSHHAGEGHHYAEKHATALRLEHEAETARGRLAQIGGELKQQEGSSQERLDVYRRAELRQVETRLAKRLKERREEEAELNTAYGPHIGLLDRIEALGSLAFEHPFMGVATFLIGLLIVLIDASPALGKSFMSIGVPHPLEKAQDEVEAEALDATKAWRAARQQAHETEASIVLEEARIRFDLEREMLKALISEEVAVQREFREEFIRQWAEKVKKLTPQLIEEALRDYSPKGMRRDGNGSTPMRPNTHQSRRGAESSSRWPNRGPWPPWGRRAA